MRYLAFAALLTLLPAGATLRAQDASTPAASDKDKKKKPKKKKKAAETPPKPPADPLPEPEKTTVAADLTYRYAAVVPRKQAAYYAPLNSADQTDQFYGVLTFSKTYGFGNEMVLQPVLRTDRESPGTWDTGQAPNHQSSSETPPIFVQQAFIETLLTSNLSVTAGKKAEFEGSGFLVAPSDLLNENRDIFDPLYQNEGVVFTRLKLRLGGSSLGLGYIPVEDQNFRDGRPWLTGSTEVAGADIRAQATYQQAELGTVGMSAARFFGSDLELHIDGRYQMRQRLNSYDTKPWTKFSAYAGPDPTVTSESKPSLFALAGTRYVLSSRRSLVAEVIDQQDGLLLAQFRPYYDSLRAQAVAQPDSYDPTVPDQLVGRHYVFGSYQDDELVHKWHLEADYLDNLDDGSSFGVLIARYAASPVTSIELAPTFYSGGRNTEFGERPYSQLYYITFKGRF